MYQTSNVYFICSFVAIGGGLFGFDISSMSGIIGTAAYRRYFDEPGSYTQGAITASMPAGSLAGSLASSFLADRFSRRRALQIACLLWILGSGVQCGATSVSMLCCGRALAGLCVGMASSLVPVYQSEIAPRNIRGRVVSFHQWAITWGILIQFFVQYAAANSPSIGLPRDPSQSTLAFRIPWGVQIVPGFVLLLGLTFFPYSPRWLAARDRWDDAIIVLARLHGGGDPRHPRVMAQYKEIEDALRFEREEIGGSLWRVFRGAGNTMRRRVLLGMAIQAWSQLCGMNIMMYYAVYLMEGVNIGSPLLAASIQYVVNVVLTLPAIMHLDKWGRRPALIVGSFLMMIIMFVSGALQQRYGQANTSATRTLQNQTLSWIVTGNLPASYAIVACSYLFVAAFAATWGPTSWTYPAEIFPGKIRTKAVAAATAANWFCNMALAYAVPPLLWKIHYRVYYIFGTFNAIAFLYVYLAAYETKGHTLEEMDDVFNSGRPPWSPDELPPSRLEEIEQDVIDGRIGFPINWPEISTPTESHSSTSWTKNWSLNNMLNRWCNRQATLWTVGQRAE